MAYLLDQYVIRHKELSIRHNIYCENDFVKFIRQIILSYGNVTKKSTIKGYKFNVKKN